MRKHLLFLGVVVLILVAIGLVVMGSASEAICMRLQGGNLSYYVVTQIKWLLLSLLIVFPIAMFFDYHKFRQWPWLTILMYFAIVVMLALVLKSDPVNGSRRWLSYGNFRLQPSELAKIVAILSLAVFVDKSGFRIERFWKGTLPAAAILGLPTVLILVETDIGSSLVVALVGGLVLFLGGIRLLHIVVAAVLSVPAIALVVMHNSNRIGRFWEFLNGTSHQLNQSLVAFANGFREKGLFGGFFGVGYTNSHQRFSYLPESHTDFIFSVGAEEFGFVFSIGVLILFVMFFAIGMRIAACANDRLGRLIAYGCTFMISFQAFWSMLVVTGLVPPKGAGTAVYKLRRHESDIGVHCFGVDLQRGQANRNRQAWSKIKMVINVLQ